MRFFNRLLSKFNTPRGRFILALLGLSIVAILIYHTGTENLVNALLRSTFFFPLIFVLEVLMLCCSVYALSFFYREDRKKIPLITWSKAGLLGYFIGGITPFGAALSDITKASVLSKYSTRAQSVAAAVQYRALSLFANSFISFFAGIAIYWISGLSIATYLIFANMFLTFIGASTILLVATRSQIGCWLGKKFQHLQKFGEEFDGHFSNNEKKLFLKAFSIEFLGRIFQVFQNWILLLAVSGKTGFIAAFISEGLHLGGVLVGEWLPAQLGALELNFTLSANILNLTPTDALSIAVLLHIAQLSLMGISAIVPCLLKDKCSNSLNLKTAVGDANLT